MKISVRSDPQATETEVTVVCKGVTREIKEMISYLCLMDNNIAGIKGEETFFIPLSEILYFETVDRKVFFYTDTEVFETLSKMYQLEETLLDTPFARISKSLIANLKKVYSIKPEKNSRMCLTFSNGEKLIVSRQYLNVIKDKLGVK